MSSTKYGEVEQAWADVIVKDTHEFGCEVGTKYWKVTTAVNMFTDDYVPTKTFKPLTLTLVFLYIRHTRLRNRITTPNSPESTKTINQRDHRPAPRVEAILQFKNL